MLAVGSDLVSKLRRQHPTSRRRPVRLGASQLPTSRLVKPQQVQVHQKVRNDTHSGAKMNNATYNFMVRAATDGPHEATLGGLVCD